MLKTIIKDSWDIVKEGCEPFIEGAGALREGADELFGTGKKKSQPTTVKIRIGRKP